jgi:hypothetical protein
VPIAQLGLLVPLCSAFVGLTAFEVKKLSANWVFVEAMFKQSLLMVEIVG